MPNTVKTTLLTDYYKKRGFSEEQAGMAVQAMMHYMSYLDGIDCTYDVSSVAEMKTYLSKLVEQSLNSEETLLALARYSYLTDKTDVYIYFTGILGIAGIVHNLAEHAERVAGPEIRKRVFENAAIPPAGSPPEAILDVTRRIVKRLREELPEDQCKRALTANVHDIPVESFTEARKRFMEAPSIDAYLADHHARLVATLQDHADSGQVWYEQIITPQVVAFVRDNPEIQAGVRKGNKITLSKIPYNPDAWLDEKDPDKKRYLACHCPMARSSLLEPGKEIPSVWCHCSAGYEKLRFDVIFEQDVEVELLECVLSGAERCRFAITIPPEFMEEYRP
ncbi:MAG: hypothetical protein KJ970_19195 [Candidatus Eisenbacteria bacterium]|uniref:Uncharacterized protein n=1 Tax=Eiseniibacteriota bacterium TaxID=2212470 RepID=A0A948S0I8_UNCEI|nr:hypothetical protein [Candidatus Eisenbacteria bacterium]MBU1949654.1 hypothetical protein [Candidatus Eisenbacteria bacterium]MBU2693047.1 hypothetical protein [Candidatus Eisenbacteria bacterium]